MDRHSAAAATRQGLYQFISVVPFQSIIRCTSLCSAPFPIGQVATQLYLSITGMNARRFRRLGVLGRPRSGPPADEDLALHDIWLLRLYALLARAHDNGSAYAQFRDHYHEMAKTLGFEGHIAWAEAMP